MEQDEFDDFESTVFNALEGKLANISSPQEVNSYISKVAKSVYPAATKEDIERVIKDANTLDPIERYLSDDSVEDIMINNTSNIFVYHTVTGEEKTTDKVKDRNQLTKLVNKLKMFSTSSVANRNIFDVHLQNGSRVNIVESPIGADITIRNFKTHAYSILDLVNLGELSYALAARFWIYAEGLKVRPANMLIGGMPAAGKTTLLNAMFSFFRPEQRIVLMEETYEVDASTQENCVRLETSPDMPLSELVKNSLRMRPDIIIIGEVRGSEAMDMMTAMNIGKICMSTIHASTARDVVTRLEHAPMNIQRDMIPLIDTMILCSQVNEANRYTRKVTQVSEVSGIETQVLLSDLFKFDYKTHKSSEILPSVTYRDTLARLTGYPPSEVLREESRRAKILEKMNQMQVRDLRSINEYCKEYYDNPERLLKKLGLQALGTL
jgi:archaeal flagellar protein FlaI